MEKKNKTRKNPLKIVWIVFGFLCLGLGTVGIVLPILPTVPFYMATLFSIVTMPLLVMLFQMF